MDHNPFNSANRDEQTIIFGSCESNITPTYEPFHYPSIEPSPETLGTVSRNPSATLSAVMQCAAENKKSKECGAKGGKDACCPGLIFHEHQSWRCVKGVLFSK